MKKASSCHSANKNMNTSGNSKSSKKILELTQELAQEKTKKLRLLADLANFQKREEAQRLKWIDLGIAEFLLQFLPGLNEIYLGVRHAKNEDLSKTMDKFFANLEKIGISRIYPKSGEKVNIDLHNVLLLEKGQKGKIVRVIESGWIFRGKTLLPAKVSAGG